jgi:hypothetical protein
LGKALHGNRTDFMTSIKCSELFGFDTHLDAEHFVRNILPD